MYTHRNCEIVNSSRDKINIGQCLKSMPMPYIYIYLTQVGEELFDPGQSSGPHDDQAAGG